MAQKVHFTPFGIPYVEEFSNISFAGSSSGKSASSIVPSRPLRPALKTSTSSSSMRSHSDLSANPKLFPVAANPLSPLEGFLASSREAERATNIVPYTRMSMGLDSTPAGGLYIHTPSHTLVDTLRARPKRTSSSRLRRLRRTIAEAVRAAGMDTPPSPAVGNETHGYGARHASCANTMRDGESLRVDLGRRSVEEAAAAEQHRERRGSLYKGTYGQVCAALKAVGLAMTPCPDAGFGEATRLGVIFVANHDAQGQVELRKLTLWG